MKETILRLNAARGWFFERMDRIDGPLVRLIGKKGERNQINRVGNEGGEVAKDTAEMQRIMGDYCEQLYGNKMGNLEEVDRFLEKFNLPRLNQKEIEIMNHPSTEIEVVIKNISQKTKAQDQMDSQENSIKNLEKN